MRKMPDGQVVFTPGRVMNAPSISFLPAAPIAAVQPPAATGHPVRKAVVGRRVIPPGKPPAAEPPKIIQVPAGFTPEQNDFIAAITKLKTDNANPPQLTPESKQIIADCVRPFPSLKNATPDLIATTAGANLPTITTCILGKVR
jgi:hypothetical protein